MPIAEKKVFDKFVELQAVFPFGAEYVEDRFPKYLTIARLLEEACPRAARILSVGSGPCDLEAILSQLGFQVTAVDDLSDPWHLIGNNRERIRDFAARMNIEFLHESGNSLQLKRDFFDAVLLIGVIEHLHTSPRELLNSLISFLKPDGVLVIETPNSVALAKRLKVLTGKTGWVDARFVYWNVGSFRGHIKEYTPSELKMVVLNHKLTNIEVKMANLQIDAFLKKITLPQNGLARIIRGLYTLTTALSPNFKDTILITAKRPQNWQRTALSISQFKKYHAYMEKYNLDGESNESLVSKLIDSSGDCF